MAPFRCHSREITGWGDAAMSAFLREFSSAELESIRFDLIGVGVFAEMGIDVSGC